jgi:hypothetical protein
MDAGRGTAESIDRETAMSSGTTLIKVTGERGAIRALVRSAGVIAACAILAPIAMAQSVVRLQPAIPAKAVSASGAAVGAEAGAVTGAATEPPDGEAGVAPTAPTDPTAGFTPKEIERLKATYDAMEDPERVEMVAVYKDMGIDIEVVLGLKPPPGAEPPVRPLPDAVRSLDFSRKPEAVLAARSQLGFTGSVMPDRSNGEALAKWLHMNVLAGEWGALDEVLAQSTPADATAIYSHILRSTNAGAQGLLPEEVLALGDACPGEMADWQIDVLSQMLNASASRYGKGLFLEKLKQGTKLFGGKDDASRARTVRLLVGGGLALEAYDFLPPLADARANGDARVMYAHARYQEDLAGSGLSGEEAETHLKQGWELLGEVSLLSTADPALRKDAMRRAIDQLPNVPPAQAKEWLNKIFADAAMGPAALEVVALQAMTFRDKKVDAEKRAQGIATMKSAVDTLLAQPDLNLETLRVPLRMLTTALADEVDAVVKEKGDQRGVARETDLLFRASPDERWLAAIEPSVAIRGYRADIAIATIADETDVALDVLTNAVKRFPDQGAEFADGFLQLWEKRLNPRARPGEDMDSYFYFYQQQRVPAAPLTRGRQRRNLEKLERLLKILSDMGVGAPKLPSVTAAFKACHARTEIFERDEIVRVFGPIESLSADTAAALADHMRTGLGGDWRNRQVQRQYGMSRSAAEIGDLVEVGYELAIELATRAVQADPGSWQDAILRAALSYDRVQFKQTQQKDDFTKYNEYRRQAFAAFQQAAEQYASLIAKGEEHDSAGVYLRWFTAVLDAGQPTPDDKEAAEAETATNDDQIKRISAAMKKLPPDAYDRHIGEFARAVADALSGVPPERKPSIVRSAVKIVGDHPAGAPLRRLAELYEDLLKNEIRLRITVDGSDQVASGQMFGVSLTLRFTNSVDRETGGFDKYLYQDAFVRVGNQYKTINYQGQIKKGIETALGDSFSVESIGFFEPMTPSRAVKEDGQMGWQEKPLAYILVKAKDPSVDRIPQISFDMHFDDTTGPVTLPIVSNSPPIDAADASGIRPLKKLQVQQVVDVRRLVNNRDDRAVTVEVSAKGDGVIPEIRSLLDGLDEALPGYKIADDAIESRPYAVVQTEDSKSQRFYGFGANTDEEKKYVTADENGIFRLPTERSWLVTYKPTGAAVAREFTLPKLKSGIEGELASRSYADMDIVKVDGPSVAVVPRWSITAKLAGILGLLALVGIGMWFYFRRRTPGELVAAGFALPSRVTPLSAIATLERMRGLNGKLDAGTREAIENDIAAIQRAYFAPGEEHAKPDEGAMRSMLEKWAGSLR